MTSNLGSQYLLDGITDDGQISEDAKNAVMAQLRSSFRPEFLNRLDEIVFYKPLTKQQITKIIDLLCTDIAKRLEDKSLRLDITEAAKLHAADEGFDPVYGARPLKRYLQSHIETLLAKTILSSDLHSGDTLRVDVKDGEFVCSVIPV